MRTDYLDFIYETARTDFKLRYGDNILGYIWSFANPILQFSVYYLVFSYYFRFQIENYPLFLITGIVLWGFFQEITMGGMKSFYSKYNLLINIRFPRICIPLGYCIGALISLLTNLSILALFYAIAGISPSPLIILLPLILASLISFGLGISLILSALYLKYRDIEHIWGVILNLIFWLTPIVYPTHIIPDFLMRIMWFNPMLRIMEYSRGILLHHIMPTTTGLIGLSAGSLITLSAGYLIFNHMSEAYLNEI
jgi:ABC-type polysaccharide/polyol phosphate export permease